MSLRAEADFRELMLCVATAERSSLPGEREEFLIAAGFVLPDGCKFLVFIAYEYESAATLYWDSWQMCEDTV